MEYKRVDNDVNGNPRYVIHFLGCMPKAFEAVGEPWDVDVRYRLTVKLMKTIGGKAYRGRDFGGGIVFQSYDIHRTLRNIQKIKAHKDGMKTFKMEAVNNG